MILAIQHKNFVFIHTQLVCSLTTVYYSFFQKIDFITRMVKFETNGLNSEKLMITLQSSSLQNTRQIFMLHSRSYSSSCLYDRSRYTDKRRSCLTKLRRIYCRLYYNLSQMGPVIKPRTTVFLFILNTLLLDHSLLFIFSVVTICSPDFDIFIVIESQLCRRSVQVYCELKQK